MVTEFCAGAAKPGASVPFDCEPRKTAATIITMMPSVMTRRMLLPPLGSLRPAMPIQRNLFGNTRSMMRASIGAHRENSCRESEHMHAVPLMRGSFREPICGPEFRDCFSKHLPASIFRIQKTWLAPEVRTTVPSWMVLRVSWHRPAISSSRGCRSSEAGPTRRVLSSGRALPAQRITVAARVAATLHPPILPEEDPLPAPHHHRPIFQDLQAVATRGQGLAHGVWVAPFQEDHRGRQGIADIVLPPEPGGGDRILDRPAELHEAENHLRGGLRNAVGSRRPDDER